MRLTESGLTKERQSKLKDSHNLGFVDPEYEVFKRGGTFYISKRSDCCGPPSNTSKQIDEDEPKVRRQVSKKNQAVISGQELLEQYADLKKMLLDEKRKRQKIKTKLNSLHSDIYREPPTDPKKPEENLKLDEESTHARFRSEGDQDQEITPTFALRNRRR